MEEVEQQSIGTESIGVTDQGSIPEGGDSAVSAPGAVPEQFIEVERLGQVEKIPLTQAKEYVQKGWDYTQKTQELATQRDALKPYMELESYLKANPDKAQQLYQTLYGGQGQDVDPVQQQLQQTQHMVNQLVKENSLNKVNQMLGEIRGDPKYGELYKDPEMEELLMATALQTGKTNLSDLKGIADRLHTKITKFQVKAEKEAEERVKTNLASPTRKGETGKGIISPPKDFDPSKANWREAREIAKQFL